MLECRDNASFCLASPQCLNMSFQPIRTVQRSKGSGAGNAYLTPAPNPHNLPPVIQSTTLQHSIFTTQITTHPPKNITYSIQDTAHPPLFTQHTSFTTTLTTHQHPVVTHSRDTISDDTSSPFYIQCRE